jgi:hypothetical protein
MLERQETQRLLDFSCTSALAFQIYKVGTGRPLTQPLEWDSNDFCSVHVFTQPGSEADLTLEVEARSMSALPSRADVAVREGVRRLCADFVAKVLEGVSEWHCSDRDSNPIPYIAEIRKAIPEITDVRVRNSIRTRRIARYAAY